MRRLLILAYYFPPTGGIGSIRMAGFVRHLPEMDWEPIVVAPRETPHAQDPSLTVPEHNVVRTRSIEFGRMGRRPTGSVTDAPTGGLGAGTRSAALRAAARRWAYFPDPQIGWYPSAVAAGLRLARDQRFDAVLSSSFPITAHLVAWSICARTGLPWIAEFRDPWSDRLPSFPYRRPAQSLERAIARHATSVVQPSRALADHFARRWGVDVASIPHGADGSPAAASELPATPVLAHVGSYYPGEQSLVAVWRALAELRKSRGVLPRIRWVGDLSAVARAELRAYGIDDLVEVTGLVPHRDALRLLASSTMLFASGQLNSDPIGRGTTPAKLAEYVASGLPVLYVGDPSGDAAGALGAYAGCHVVPFGDVDGVRRALESGLAGGTYERDTAEVSRRTRAAELASLLNSIVGPG